jgi:hypothetical protein
VRILPKSVGDPVATASVCDVEKLTHRVLALAYTALQRAIAAVAPEKVTARREQRVMSWLVCSVTGVNMLAVTGQMAEAAGPRLLKAGGRLVHILYALRQDVERGPKGLALVAEAEETIYPAEGGAALPWALAPVPAEHAPAPVPAPAAAAPALKVAAAPTEPAYVPPVLSHTRARQLGVEGVTELAAFLNAIRPAQGKLGDDELIITMLPFVVSTLASEVTELRRQIVVHDKLAKKQTEVIATLNQQVSTIWELREANEEVSAARAEVVGALEHALECERSA